ncbi:MAG: hypothetical protein ACI8SK_000262 [Shewanella sp.]|jgi:hypothetical protein
MNEVFLNRCFASPLKPSASSLFDCSGVNSQRIKSWVTNQYNSAIYYSEEERNSLAHLIPLLLCGEQSAQLVFNNEINRILASNEETCSSVTQSLMEVETDEMVHDMALQQVQSELPIVEHMIDIQRQAKRFYLQLGRVNSYCEHFVRIAILDTCVTQIMHEFEHSGLGKGHPFAILCGLIKKDEAKHVYVAKHHAQYLGASKAMFAAEHEMVLPKLYTLLSSQSAHFEALGIELTQVFTKLEDKWA